MAGRKRKNQYRFLTRKFPVRMQKKLVVLFMAVILAFLILIVRITYINVTKGSIYTRQVLNQLNYDSRTIAYKRGDIVDRNGTTLATSERVYNVILDVAVLLTDEDCVEPTIDVLVDCFGIEENTIREAIENHPESNYVVLLEDVDYETAQVFEAIDEDNENYPNIKGVWLEEDYIRTYPYGSLASDVIGFTYSGNVGALGIESSYNDVLNGTDGREYGYFDENSTVERTVEPAVNGQTVVSTIDAALQSIVEEKIAEFNEKYETDGLENGSANTAVIIMDPNTGEILAEASYPTFDLNSPRDLSNIYSDEDWEALTEDEQLDAMSELWRNFCVSDAFEPGSTIKPFTIAAALETGAITGDETYYCSGYLHVTDYDIKCHTTGGHGTITVEEAVAYSCNVALMNVALSMDYDDFSEYQHIFGFGEYTGIDLPGEASTSSLLYTAEEMTSVDVATNSFGQNFNVTMTQLVSAFCSLINGGYYYEPHVVKQILDEDGNIIETRDPVLLRKTVSEETSEQIKTYLRATVEYGTGARIVLEDYDLGGKTGTAQKLPRGNGKYLLSFIGYAPQDDPEVVVYVVLDEANVSDQDTTSMVLELAQSIMEEAFPYLGITKIDTADEDADDEEEADEDADDADADDADDADAESDTDTEGDTDTESDTDTDSASAADTDEEYIDYDEDYEETYDNEDGSYIDEDYDPDLDSWTTVSD